jgi:vacuolar iron transporter family protein
MPVSGAERIMELGGQVPQYTGSELGQADSLATQIGGTDLALRRLEIDEGRDIAQVWKAVEGAWR